jgi:hypothetical protein
MIRPSSSQRLPACGIVVGCALAGSSHSGREAVDNDTGGPTIARNEATSVVFGNLR